MSDPKLLTHDQLAEIRWRYGVDTFAPPVEANDARQLLGHIDAQQATITRAALLAEKLLDATPDVWSDEECEALAELCDVLDPIDADHPTAAGAPSRSQQALATLGTIMIDTTEHSGACLLCGRPNDSDTAHDECPVGQYLEEHG